MSTGRLAGFVPPVYPFERLGEAAALASAHPGGAVDLSIGTPCDPPPPAVVAALGSSGAERGYPRSIGSDELREAASGWMGRRFGLAVPARAIAACVGTKELVASLPGFLRLRSPSKDTVLCPSVAYPTYAMGAVLGGCRTVLVPPDALGRLDLASIDPEDAKRALCLWVNSPGNPAGQLEDLEAAASFGRRHLVPVFSDECYVEFTWTGPPRSILDHGSEGVVALHSLSKRSNLAGLRVGFMAGDEELVSYLAAARQHAGLMVPGPIQHAAAVALHDDHHVEAQRRIYAERLSYVASMLCDNGLPAHLPDGGFYIFAKVPDQLSSEAATTGESPAFSLSRLLARDGGVIVSPGDFYGPLATCYVRLAMVAPLDRLRLVGERLERSGFAAAASIEGSAGR
ncbi:MAG: aminotransferase class I/II-fold pyridoxal phosphate-dependent enzyme [Acidimicrobiales bacterium]